jgi:predicted Zn finger-like uncharacterized protein
MIIACPHCLSGYLLPEHLMGAGGARVRCPHCQHLFAVGADGLPRIPAVPPADAGAPGPTFAVAAEEPAPQSVPRGGDEQAVAARAALDALAERCGEALERAVSGRRLFSEFGPALMEAYEDYRCRAGREAGASAFREALLERWGVELVPLGVARED